MLAQRLDHSKRVWMPRERSFGPLVIPNDVDGVLGVLPPRNAIFILRAVALYQRSSLEAEKAKLDFKLVDNLSIDRAFEAVPIQFFGQLHHLRRFSRFFACHSTKLSLANKPASSKIAGNGHGTHSSRRTRNALWAD